MGTGTGNQSSPKAATLTVDAVVVDGTTVPVTEGTATIPVLVAPGIWSVIVGTRSVEVILDARSHAALVDGEEVDAFVDGTARRLRFDDARRRSAVEVAAQATDGSHAVNVIAPMPGRIIEVRVQVGQVVARGETVAVIEAMKMESVIIAPHAGTVVAVLVAPPALVTTRQPLLRIEGSSR